VKNNEVIIDPMIKKTIEAIQLLLLGICPKRGDLVIESR
jgi:hypothetical protein